MKAKGFFGMLMVALIAVAGLAACNDDDDVTDKPDDTKPSVTVEYTVYDVDVDYMIDAVDKSGIEADLKANRPLPEGAQYATALRRYSITLPLIPTLEIINGADTTTVGNIMYGDDDAGVLPEAYKSFLPEESIDGYRELEIYDEDSVTSYHAFFHLGIPEGNGIGSIVYFYEDLTNKYLDMFPDVRINTVLRRQTLTFNHVKKSSSDSVKVFIPSVKMSYAFFHRDCRVISKILLQM